MSVDELTPTTVSTERVESTSGQLPADRRITWARLRGRVAWWCVAAAGVAAVGYALGTVVAGRLAADPTGWLVVLAALFVVGGAILDTAGRAGWARVVDQHEGRARRRARCRHPPRGPPPRQSPGPSLEPAALGAVRDRGRRDPRPDRRRHP